MTDIFISYSRKDVEMVSILARTLEETGYSVWWDVSGLHGGQSFAKVIQQKLNEAKCAIVVWSPDSVESNWVHSEATLADNRGILLTAVYREASAPMPFNNRHNEDLRGWNGNVFNEGFQKLIKAVHRLCPIPSGKHRQAEAEPLAQVPDATTVCSIKTDSGSSGSVKKWGAGIVAIAVCTGGYYFYSQSQAPVAPASPAQTSLPQPTVSSAQQDLMVSRQAEEVAAAKKKAEEQQVALDAEKAKKAASSKVYNLPNNLTLLPIPAGEFMMGSDSGQDNEKPVHKVTFAKSFWMSKTEITFDQYDAYVKATGKSLPEDKGGWGRGSRPVIYVSWNDAQGYVKWLSSNNDQGSQCRLPSEAEWEYSARAGSITKYSWGDTIGKNKANCRGCGSQWDKQKTAPVGSFPENAWGLHDMHGNVWEWVQDTYQASYEGAPSNGEARVKGDGLRVLRGGSWFSTPLILRSAYRSYGSPDSRGDGFGFRVVCSPPSVR